MSLGQDSLKRSTDSQIPKSGTVVKPKGLAGVVVVTGAASGIGRSSALLCAELGAHVVLADKIAAEETAAELAPFKDRVATRIVDITVPADVSALVREAASLWDVPLLGGVLAAGIASARGATPTVRGAVDDEETTVREMNLDDFDRVHRVNVFGTLHVLQALLRHIPDGTAGSIVLVSSTAASIPLHGGAAYGSSKRALEALARVAALEEAGRVRINVVAPGYVETPMTSGIRKMPEAHERAMSITPMGRFGAPHEIASAIAFLLGDGASFITGEVLHVSGGQHA